MNSALRVPNRHSIVKRSMRSRDAASTRVVASMRQLHSLIHIFGWFVFVVIASPAHAQFAQRVLGESAASSSNSPTVLARLQQAQEPPENTTAVNLIQPGIKLPSCPNARLLSIKGVPARWRSMSMKQQVANPINAMMMQMAYVPWQNEPKGPLGKCLDNMGVDVDSVRAVHKYVLPYLGTMTAVVMRAGDKGVFVSFRGTDFDDAGDVLVDADCQHTGELGRQFGSKRHIRLHTGFHRAWESVAPTVIQLMEKQLQQTSTKKVYFIGHSLGGAMAAIGALRMNYLWRDTANKVGGVWLFGCPRVGNKAWMEEYNSKLLTRTLRMANFADFASRLPMQSQICTSATILGTFEFRHVGRALVLCPDAKTGLARWRLYPNGSEVLDCGSQPDSPDFTVTTHWLGPYLDAWRRAHASAFAGSGLSDNPFLTSVMCDECSLSFPNDRNKQLNVPARAGGPIGCCTSASCSTQSAWDAVATIGAQVTRTFNPESACVGYICT